jgi:hypothetical protein
MNRKCADALGDRTVVVRTKHLPILLANIPLHNDVRPRTPKWRLCAKSSFPGFARYAYCVEPAYDASMAFLFLNEPKPALVDCLSAVQRRADLL